MQRHMGAVDAQGRLSASRHANPADAEGNVRKGDRSAAGASPTKSLYVDGLGYRGYFHEYTADASTWMPDRNCAVLLNLAVDA